MANLASQASLPGAGPNSPAVQKALEYQRLLMAKRVNLGVNTTFQAVLCLHMAAQKLGHSVDVKLMSKIAGAKSKTHYLSTCQSAEKLLEVGHSLSVQEVAVQLGVSHVAAQAAKIIHAYEMKLVEALGPARSGNVSLDKPMYPCAAVHAAAKAAGLKVDNVKLAELSRCKKKELAELVEAMTASAPASSMEAKKKGVTKQLQFVEQIMGTEGEEMEDKGGNEAGIKEE